jgi:sigma-B regulation protein RsbU (phosphoserine phosphatase)
MCQTWQGTNTEPQVQNASFINEAPQQQLHLHLDKESETIRALKEELEALQREQSKLYRSIFEAAQTQRRLCAPRQYHSGDFEVAGEIFPVRHLSGDFFKVIELDSALGIVVGDIAGKGLSAGIWLPHLVSLIHRCARMHRNPADAMAEANRDLCAGYGEPPLVAVFFARIDLADGGIIYCNAGLPSPVIFGREGSAVHLEKGGPMLGAKSDADFNVGNVTLLPGQTLIACSDGVTECQNSRDEEFELPRLINAARAASGGSANQTLFSTLGVVLDFADKCSLSDDLTLLVVRRAEQIARHDQPGGRNSLELRHERVGAAMTAGAAGQNLVS